MSQEVANTILAQLGGGRFSVMTGAKNFLGLPDGLAFSIGRNASSANKVKITLCGDDTYTVRFSKFSMKKLEDKELKVFDGIYAENLTEVFTRFTGLYTRL